jgi:protein-tyrosine kinase
MSRNFELLRRARKDEGLFLPPTSDGSLDDPRAQGEGEVRNKSAELDKAESPFAPLMDDPSLDRPCALGNGQQVRDEVIELETAEATWPRPELKGREQEELLKLVRRVFLSPNSDNPRAVTFSSVEGNSSSEICLRTGEVLAAQGSMSVCLVDANLYAPSLHALGGISKSPGLAEATIRSGPIKSFSVRVKGGNLWMVPPGSAPDVKGNFLAWDRLSSRLAELRRTFDYVLIDAPPVTSDGFAVLLGQMAEGVILVLEANSTRRQSALLAKKVMETANITLLGAILNNRTFPIPEALYRML